LFVGRENVAAVESERRLKREGVTDQGSIRNTHATAGADFRLTGRIATSDAVDNRSGLTQRFTQITFELVDLEYGTIVWSNIYDYAKAAQDDIVYR
jgi:penicillin-binding protein activator